MAKRIGEIGKEVAVSETTKTVLGWLLPLVLTGVGLAFPGVRRIVLSLPYWLLLALTAVFLVTSMCLAAFVAILRQRVKHLQVGSSIPTQTLAILLRHERSAYYWSGDSHGGKPSTTLTAMFIVTNKTDIDIRPSGARSRKGTASGWVSVKGDDSRMFEWTDIPPRKVVLADVEIRLRKVLKEGQSFKTDIAILDQFGNENWIRGVEFFHGPKDD